MKKLSRQRLLIIGGCALFVVALAAGSVVAIAGGDGESERREVGAPASTSTSTARSSTTSTSTTTPPAAPPSIQSTGALLATVAGHGSVYAGTTKGLTSNDLSVAAAPTPTVPEALAIAPGLSVEAPADLTGLLELRLPLPPRPTDDAIAVVVHVADDGSHTFEPGLIDPQSNEILVGASTFSDRFGGWLSVVSWLEKLDHAATNYATGRTDPPPCRKDAPSWASVTTHELSSLHVCLQKNTSTEGVERAEVFLKSNRRTAQFVTVPAWRDYLWVDSQPPAVRELLTAAAGGNRNDVLLLGGDEMSWGSRQPFLDESYDVLAYQNGFIGMVNQVGAMIGAVPASDQLGVAFSALECVREAGLDDTTIKCILTLLENPDLAIAGFDDLLRGVNLGVVERNQFLGVVRKGLDRLAPSAKALVKALAFTEAVINTWDAIWDNLADGKLTLSLKGTRQPGSSPPSAPPPPSPAGTRPPTTSPPATRPPATAPPVTEPTESCPNLAVGHWLGWWRSSAGGPPRLLTAEVSVDSGRVAGEVDVSGSFVPGGAIDGAVSCGRVRFGRVDNLVEFDATISSDGKRLSGTYTAWQNRAWPPADRGTFTLDFEE